ncbi:MAG: hypothetical protein F4090_03740 [Nitrospira sp. SB0672_bin_25]|nr:hypothetical protein [Nitrospira sp. SB0666_bin_27]MYF24870.1 hypothetical protein [Nitrospira sp. SB0678_bin_10]MYJ54012.1 hypothetical protein [Nitrospira sp. SB0672_bin_25]
MKTYLTLFLLFVLAGVPALALGWDTPDLSGKTFCSKEQVDLVSDDLIADGDDYYDEDEADEDI